jgi:D-alanyl-D-alanine carboxypeptidase
MGPEDDGCPQNVLSALQSCGIPRELIASRSLALQDEARQLAVAEIGENGREHLLAPAAAKAWRELRAAAQADGVSLRIVSAFRSVERQAELVQAKLARGQSLEAVLAVSAPPGYSEHHSGCAVDLTTEGVAPLEEEFERTPAFRWLSANAARFGFSLSFPRGNPHGYAYEPWHWRWA